jgi:hypothetical protein
MKKVFGWSAALLLVCAAVFAQQPSAEGSWDVTIESPQGKREAMLVIKKEGDKLTGAMKSPRGERPLQSVTQKGDEITFVMNANINGQDMVFTYKGKVEKASMKGDADFGGFATGSWSAVPHKEGAAPASSPSAPAAAAGNISGVWDFAVETPNGSGQPVFTFKQDGENLSGTYKGQFGEAPLTGTVKGSDVKFSIKINFQGQDFTVTYNGKVDGSAMKGTVVLGELGEGTFTGKKR